MLKLGQVFKLGDQLVLCLKVNDCSARVVDVTMDKVNNPGVIFDDYDRYGYRVSSNSEVETVCFVPRGRIFTHAEISVSKSKVLGYEYVPIPVAKWNGAKPRKAAEVAKHQLVDDEESDQIVRVLRASSKILFELLSAAP